VASITRSSDDDKLISEGLCFLHNQCYLLMKQCLAVQTNSAILLLTKFNKAGIVFHDSSVRSAQGR
jgi:hypothetical protein